jgi:hypothetical protein
MNRFGTPALPPIAARVKTWVASQSSVKTLLLMIA